MNFLRKCTGPGMFRLLLATLVFVHHLSRFAVGLSAVYIFFGLSGYWIYRMWIGRYSKTVQPYVTYLISRGWRLLPSFMLLGLFAIGMQRLLGHSVGSLRSSASWTHFVASQLFIFGYDSLPMKPLAPAWSLDFEMQFYVVAPLLVLCLVRWRRPRVLLGVMAVLSLVSAIWLGAHVLTSYLAFFFFGMVAAKIEWRPSLRLVTGMWLVVLAAVGFCMITPLRGLVLIGTHRGPLAVYNLQANVILSILLLPYAIYTTRQKGFASDGMFADLSYIVYLLHWPVSQILNIPGRFGMGRLPATAMVLVIVYLLSYLIWKLYDRPINDLRSRWVAGRKAVGRPSVRAVQVEPAAP